MFVINEFPNTKNIVAAIIIARCFFLVFLIKIENNKTIKIHEIGSDRNESILEKKKNIKEN